MSISIHLAWVNIKASYRARKAGLEPDLRVWEFIIQMLCSAYLSWRWLGKSAKFRPFSPQYWLWVAQYSSLSELGTRASLAAANYRPKNPTVPEFTLNRAFVHLPFAFETGEQLGIEPGAVSGRRPPRTTRPNPASPTHP